jgi:hypothetical protein
MAGVSRIDVVSAGGDGFMAVLRVMGWKARRRFSSDRPLRSRTVTIHEQSHEGDIPMAPLPIGEVSEARMRHGHP